MLMILKKSGRTIFVFKSDIRLLTMFQQHKMKLSDLRAFGPLCHVGKYFIIRKYNSSIGIHIYRLKNLHS